MHIIFLLSLSFLLVSTNNIFPEIASLGESDTRITIIAENDDFSDNDDSDYESDYESEEESGIEEHHGPLFYKLMDISTTASLEEVLEVNLPRNTTLNEVFETLSWENSNLFVQGKVLQEIFDTWSW